MSPNLLPTLHKALREGSRAGTQDLQINKLYLSFQENTAQREIREVTMI